MNTKKTAQRFLWQLESVAARRCRSNLLRSATAVCPKLAFLVLGLCGLPHAYAAKITVDNNAGGSVFGACTLLDAVISADNDAAPPGSTCESGNGADTIVFKSGITRIVFSQPANFLLPDALLVTDDLTIDGGAEADSGVPQVTLSRSAAPGTESFRLIETIKNLTLRGLAIENGHMTGNGNVFCGGAIRVASDTAALNVFDSIIRNNSTEGDDAIGGAVCGASGNWRHVTVTGNHTSGRAAHGGAISAWHGGSLSLNLDYSLVDGNFVSGANALGGGIYTDQGSPSRGKGGVSMFASVVSRNKAVCDQCDGGGIYGLGEMAQSRIENNETSGNGGGFYASQGFFTGPLLFRPIPSLLHIASSISGNHAGKSGGGVYFPKVEGINVLKSVSIYGNTTDGNGGGVFVSQGSNFWTASATISSNASSGDGGGIFIERDGCFDMKRTTISANQILGAGRGAGLMHGGKLKGAPDNCDHIMDLVLVYGNLGGKDIDTDNTLSTDIVDITGAYDLFGNVAATLVSPPVLTCNPNLGPLADNGGGVLTHALPAGSCALDQTPPSGGGIDDERGSGYSSIYGSGQDIGAYEAQPSAVTTTGACGKANGGLTPIAPTTTIDLCASGFPGKVLVDDSNLTWRWTCGTRTECSARKGSQQWTITPSVIGNGSISPNTPQLVADGGKLEFAVAAAAGNLFSSYTYCGNTTNVDPDQATVSLLSINVDCSIAFNFKTSPAPQNGVCGSDNGKALDTVPTHLCSAGTPSVLGGSGPWQWSCARVNVSGKAVACSANESAVASTHAVNASAGTGGVINPSGAQSVADGGTLTFTITNYPGYVTAGVTGCGGHLSGNVYTTAPITADCIVAATFATANAPVSGVCGSDAGKTLSSSPVNLCNAGTPSSVLGNGPWTWSCQGSGGGTDVGCAAQKAVTLPPAPVSAPVLDRWAVALLLLSLGGIAVHRRFLGR